MNRQKAKVHEDGSISFATEKSPYRVIVYDKEKGRPSVYITIGNLASIMYILKTKREEHIRAKMRERL